MSLLSGTRLGSYEIVSRLGADGIGEVYLARDQKLRRDVAIKVLPEKLALSSVGLSVSPDGQWIIYPQNDVVGSDIILVENFR